MTDKNIFLKSNLNFDFLPTGRLITDKNTFKQSPI